MKTYARIVDGHAVDVTRTDDLAALFHADLVGQFVVVPDGTQNGATFDSATQSWTNPAHAPAEPVAAQLPRLTPMTFYLAFSPAERIQIKTSTDPLVAEFWDTYQRAERTNTEVDPNLVSIRDGLAYLTQTTPPILASDGRVSEILAGVPQ